MNKPDSMKKLLLLLIPLLFALVSCIDSSPDFQSLNHGWNLKTDTLGIDLQVNVPSLVQADLYDNGLTAHPYQEDVEPQLQWIAQRTWDYTLTFDVAPEVWRKKTIDLVFKGLDTYADVWLNGEMILHADNMFVRYEKEVKSLLRKRDNRLKVRFYPFDARRDSLIGTYPLRFPEKYAVMRKAAYQNGWDWAPRYLNVGIWKDVELTGWNYFKVDNVAFLTESINGNAAQLSANVHYSSRCEQLIRFTVFHKGVKLAERNIICKGDGAVKIPVKLKKANLWWPNGMGEPSMTEFEVLVSRDDQLISSHKVKTGVRTIELIEEPDSIGSAMYFKVNGRKVYIKGANYVPEEMIETWMSKSKTARLLAECVPAHFNMLRVWGGGIYPPDYFYDICDSLGLMVWQDFMFAGTTYPYSDEFLGNVRNEAVQQVIRYQNHPSLALWCGNNEVSEGYVNWGWQKSMGWSDADYAEMKHGMEKLFVDILSQVVKTYDGTRPYWPSSPKNGWGKPESLTEGDVHYWGVWWGELPYEAYLQKVGRFNSEFGYQAYPDIDTRHQKHPRGEELIEKHVSKYVCRDVPWRVSTWDQKVYYSQLSQAWGVGLAIEAQRAAKPRSMGTLYWQLNDAWPVISWSSIDYAGNKKALHWKLSQLYAPILIGVLPTADGRFTVYANSDRPEPVFGTLTLDVRDFDGKQLRSYSEKILIPENGCLNLPLDVNKLVDGLNRNEIYIEMQLFDNDDNTVYAKRLQYLVYPKDLQLKPVELHPTVDVEWGIGAITLKSRTLVKDICIVLPDGCTDLSDNFFDLEPNKIKIVTFRTPVENPEIRLITLNND